MATILAFPTASATHDEVVVREISPRTIRGSAELIFFPGVRYERAATAPEPSSRRSKRMKVRELIDMMD